MSKSIAEQLESVQLESEQGTDASLNLLEDPQEPQEHKCAFNTLDTLTHDELKAIERLVSVRMKPLEVQTLETQYPTANIAELFIIYKMKSLAKEEILAYEWRIKQKDWKGVALVATRNVLKGDPSNPHRKNAEHDLKELDDNVPYVYHKDIINWLSTRDALDCSSKDERILEMQKYFKS